MSNRRLRSLQVGMPKDYFWNGKEEMSGIGKTEIDEVLLTKEDLSATVLRIFS
ncbi:hypothetical protein PB1_12809 [Bacillus methanolicus PB1]|uniref:Uncharacterized protein n=1 Tax=Bacillus methanolicus PB1 TaxID=997296 RepID=I3DW19_BACMT|nr:hypothetical protein [Bacillus methanolicus]EIJ78440.1 hypothetical protein PB1_12809 [Bacillus methanolicus PB1]